MKAHLASKFHDDYDAGIAEFAGVDDEHGVDRREPAWREQEGLEPDPTVSMVSNRTHAANGRRRSLRSARAARRHGCRRRRGVVELLRGELVPVPVPDQGRVEGVDACVQQRARASSPPSTRSASSSRTRSRSTTSTPRSPRCEWAASAGCKSLQLPVFPAELGLPDYWEPRYDPLWAAIQETELPICCHIGLNTQLDDLARRDPTPQKGIFVPMVAAVGRGGARACGSWVACSSASRG